MPQAAVTVEAAAEEVKSLEQRMRDITAELKTTRSKLKGWREVHRALVRLDGNGAAQPDEERIPRRDLKGEILAILRDGGDHTLTELTDRVGSSASSTMTALVRDTRVERASLGKYRLARAPLGIQPPISRPASNAGGAEQPDLARLEPLGGPPTQARCPTCRDHAFVKAIGMNRGRYVFRCPSCTTSFFNEHPNAR